MTVLRHSLPRRVTAALVALWAAWAISALALFVNQVVHHGAGIGPGPSLGLVSLAIQALLFVLLGRSSALARALVVVVLIVAALPLQMIGRLAQQQQLTLVAGYSAGFVLKAMAVYLLFTGSSRKFFE